MKTVWLLLGPTGSGKSTVSAKIRYNNPDKKIVTYCWDTLKLNWYNEHDYNAAWKAAAEDGQFINKAIDEFKKLVDRGMDIIVDNTNLTPKTRRRFLVPAKQAGYHTIAVVFNVPLQTLIDRQLTREDKTVPTHSVIQQFNSYVLPTEGEFDVVFQASDIS